MTSNRFLGILVRMDTLDSQHLEVEILEIYLARRGGLRRPRRSADLQESDIQQGGQVTSNIPHIINSHYF